MIEDIGITAEYGPKPGIEVIHWSNQALEQQFVPHITEYYQQICAIVDNLPATMKIYFDERPIDNSYPSDGTAYAHDIVTLVINPKYIDDPESIMSGLKRTMFHEVFHIRQHFSLEDEKRSAIEGAIYEGCATIFEREYTASHPPQGDYSEINPELLRTWYDQLKEVTADQYFEPSGVTHEKWAFYDPETGEKWKVYRTGTWVVDHVLAARSLDVIDLRDVTPQQIIAWFEELLAIRP